ncbi:serine hydrolase domain-containing protein [Amorphoplanes digitatis]|uniref:serine hydrolase domain-containing protein n=1 Tax=Actinoplanes digitatis TaxID=1868 RepID=UPI001EF3188D|nr:serine hydrolase domain-containing protein [Actinoplanes digitatis]
MRAVPLTRRGLLGTGISTAAVALTGCGGKATPIWTEPAPTLVPVADQISAAAPPAYAARVRNVLTRYLKPTSDNPKHPGYAGAVALVMVDGKTTLHSAVGHALRYKAGPVELAANKRVAMKPDSIFDLASLTKVYTALLVLQLVDQGKVELDQPLRKYLPEFTGTGKGAITVAMLLAHTSALPVGAKVTGLADNASRWKAVLTTPLVKGGVPGTTFRYSSVGLMVLGRLVERLTGKNLDKALRDNLLTPRGRRRCRRLRRTRSGGGRVCGHAAVSRVPGRSAVSNSCRVPIGAGRAKWYPWARWQPMRRSRSACPGVSTASANVTRFRLRPRATIVRTNAISRGLPSSI